MIALGYLFSLVAMAALLVLLGLELLVAIVAIRFGATRLIAPVIERHAALLGLFGRSLWLRSRGETCRVPLARAEAPALFAMLDSLAGRLGIAVPREVVVEMNVGAWVELRGWRQGSRNTRLGVGYDLLAGLTEREVEAVLAHEMVHARLVRRGLKTWLGSGRARIATLANQLSNRQEAFRLAKKSSSTGAICLACAHACARVSARLVAAYSRQDEFEADLGAARLCGSAAIRSALAKTDELALRTSRLGWHERVAQLQQGGGYAAWLLAELSAPDAPPGSAEETATDPYSTHPSTRDRLDALPPADGPAPAGASGIGLLAAPDSVADRIIAEIERIGALQEARDDRQLRALARKIRSGAATRPLHFLGVMLVIAAVAILFFSFAGGFHALLLAAALGIGAGGVLAYRLGHYDAALGLPAPSFALIEAGLARLRETKDFEAEQKRLEAALLAGLDGATRKKDRVARHREQAFAALARCDFLEAHVAARLGLTADGKSVPCALAMMIAGGSLRQSDLVAQNLRFLRAQTGLRTPDILWGAAWSLWLVRDWAAAESLLLELQKLRPDDLCLTLLAADSAARRGKRQTALTRARAAVALAPLVLEPNRLLLDLLVDGGHLREASERAERLPAAMLQDPALRLCRTRLHLLRRDFDAAHALELALLGESADDAPLRLQLAAAHEGMRRHDRAWELYEETTRLGHYPEALVGLGRLASQRGRREEARTHLLAALNTQLPLGPKAVPPLTLFGVVTSGLLSLRGPGVPCQAWIATFDGGSSNGPLTNRSFVIFARDEAEARADMKIVADAIHPPLAASPLLAFLRLAPKDRQPVGLVVPGVQDVWQ